MGQQCNARRECEHYQSEDPNPTQQPVELRKRENSTRQN